MSVQKRSIKRNLTYLLLMMSLIPLVCALAIAYIQRTSVMKMNTLDKLTAIRDLKEIQMRQWNRDLSRDIKSLSEDALFIGISRINEDNRTVSAPLFRNIATRFSSYVKTRPAYWELLLLDGKKGTVLLSTDSSSLGDSWLKEPLFTVPLTSGEMFKSPMYRDPVSGRMFISLSYPIFGSDDKNEITNVLVAHIDLENSLYKIVNEKTGLGKTGETLLVDERGVALNPLLWNDEMPLKLKITAKPAVYAASGKTGIIQSKDYRGEEVLAAYTYLSHQEWGFICKQDLKEVNKPVVDMGKSFLMIFLISTIFIVCIALYFGSKLTSPIIKIDDLSKEFKKGNLSARNTINTPDEIGSLAKSINEMAASLERKSMINEGATSITNALVGVSTKEDFAQSLLTGLQEECIADYSSFYVLSEDESKYDLLLSNHNEDATLRNVDVQIIQEYFCKYTLLNSVFNALNLAELLNKLPLKNTDLVRLVGVPVIVDEKVKGLIILGTRNKFKKFSFSAIGQAWFSINTAFSRVISTEKTVELSRRISTYNEKLQEKSDALALLLEDVNQSRKELSIANKNLKDTNDELKAFSYSVSHDLRAPLRAISGFTNILLSDYGSMLDSEGIRIGRVIEQNAHRMARLIDDLLNFSRLSRVTLSKNRVNMNRVIEEVIEEVIDKETLNKIQLSVNELPPVWGDKSMIKQVWINLISNAVKYSSRRASPNILISCDMGNDDPIFSIIDNGAGFDMKYVDKLFGVFQRLHSNDEFEGTGVGLAICKRIIKKHGGHIWAESELDKGTKFYLSLPQEPL